MTDLQGRIAIVTGGGQGVGRGISLALAKAGATVVIFGRTRAKLDATVAEMEEYGGRGHTIVGDVCKPSDLHRLVEETVATFGGLDILVNNAQLSYTGPLLEIEERCLIEGFESGPLATFRLMRLAHPHIAKRPGVIINLGSGSALRANMENFGTYAAVKEAIRVLTRAAACEWGPQGIRVLSIIPAVKSDGYEEWRTSNREADQRWLSSVPLRKMGDPEQDVGHAVAFLCSDAAGFITGSSIALDGGASYQR